MTGAAVPCQYTDCTGLQVVSGPGGTNVWKQWVVEGFVGSAVGCVTNADGSIGCPPLTNLTFYGHWQTIGTASDNSGVDWAWWGTFFQNVGHNLIHGIRQPGESFGSCFYYNANATTGGTIGKIGAAAAALAPFAAIATTRVANIYQGDPEFPGATMSLNMRIAVPAAIQIGVWAANATGNLAVAAKVANGSFFAMYNGTLALGYVGAVAGGAAIGTVIGSAINCIQR